MRPRAVCPGPHCFAGRRPGGDRWRQVRPGVGAARVVRVPGVVGGGQWAGDAYGDRLGRPHMGLGSEVYGNLDGELAGGVASYQPTS